MPIFKLHLHSAFLKSAVLLWAFCLFGVAGLVACSKEEPKPSPPKHELRFTSTDSQGLAPGYKIQINANATSFSELNTALGSIQENGVTTVDLTRLTNRDSYFVYLTLDWLNVIKRGPLRPRPASTIKAELLLENKVLRTTILTATNGKFEVAHTCLSCSGDESWLIVDLFTVQKP